MSQLTLVCDYQSICPKHGQIKSNKCIRCLIELKYRHVCYHCCKSFHIFGDLLELKNGQVITHGMTECRIRLYIEKSRIIYFCSVGCYQSYKPFCVIC